MTTSRFAKVIFYLLGVLFVGMILYGIIPQRHPVPGVSATPQQVVVVTVIPKPTRVVEPTHVPEPTKSIVKPAKIIPTITVRELGAKLGPFFQMDVVAQKADGSIQIEVEDEQYLLVDNAENGWHGFCAWLADEHECAFPWDTYRFGGKMKTGTGLATYTYDDRGQGICFEQGITTMSYVHERVELIEGEYITGTTETHCFQTFLVMASGTYAQADVYLDYDWILETVAVTGYVHLEFEEINLSSKPRDPKKDAEAVALATQLVGLDRIWSGKPDEPPGGPMEACWDLEDGWFYLGIAPGAVEYLCDVTMIFEERYVVQQWGGFADTWTMGVSLVPPTQPVGTIFNRMEYQGILFEVGEACESYDGTGKTVYLTYITHGTVALYVYCVGTGEYLFVGPADKFTGVEQIVNVDVPAGTVTFRAP